MTTKVHHLLSLGSLLTLLTKKGTSGARRVHDTLLGVELNLAENILCRRVEMLKYGFVIYSSTQ